jgi:spore maturation protein CgeB
MTSILYIGRRTGTSGQRLAALQRLGFDVTLADPYAALPSHKFVRAWIYKTGTLGFEGLVYRFLDEFLTGRFFDAALVDNGELLSARTVARIRQASGRVGVFNQDNPFTARDGHRWRLLRKALPIYDVYITPRASNVDEAAYSGARQVLRVWFSADEIAHKGAAINPDEHQSYTAEVSFVGTWMPERGPFMLKLLDRGVPLKIFGARWSKDPHYAKLEPSIASGELVGDEYARAIANTKVSLALLSRGNADLHTTRSLEIPTIGGLLLGERTSEHVRLYEEGREAVFWSSAEECANACLGLLQDNVLRRSIATAGQLRALKNNHFNERWLSEMVDAIVHS